MQNSDKNKVRSGLDDRANELTLHCVEYYILPATIIEMVVYFAFRLLGNYIPMHIASFEVTARGLGFSAVFLLTADFISRKIGNKSPKLKYIWIFSFVMCTFVLQVQMSYVMYLAVIAPLIFSAMYIDRRALVFAYITTLLSSIVSVFLGYKMGLCDANMYVLPLDKVSEYTELSATIKPIKEVWLDLVPLFILPRVILITASAILIYFVVAIHRETYKYKVEAEIRGEYDQLTGVYSRNHYENALNETYLNLDTVLLIFFDINNLKFTNDTKGHEVGDELIKKAAESIKLMADLNVDIYRFGGDEFLAVIKNRDLNDAGFYIEKWKNALNELNANDSSPICEVAYGFAAGKGEDFSKILREADMHMYKNKIATKENRPV